MRFLSLFLIKTTSTHFKNQDLIEPQKSTSKIKKYYLHLIQTKSIPK